MAKLYVGDQNGVAQEVSKLYVGVNGVAQEVSKLYAGDANGVARLVYRKKTPPTAYLIFSAASDYTLAVANATRGWDGTLKYSTDGATWTEWDGTAAISSANGKLYLAGEGNTKITGTRSNANRFVLTGSNISCAGNIETLLDWQTVADGAHPTMADNCYYGMFSGCTALLTPPKLPALTLTNFCYALMFYGCTALVAAPELPSTTLAERCYYYMFYGCTALKIPPALPATTIAGGCYEQMFYGCTALTTLPELPATTLLAYCYSEMFYNCKAIKLSRTKTGSYQYEYRIPTSGTGTAQYSSSLEYMFSGTGGSFTGTPSVNTTYYATAKWSAPTAYLTFSAASDFTVAVYNATKNWGGILEYSTDATTWTEWDGTAAISSANGKLYLRGEGNTTISYTSRNRWVLTGSNISCVGNIETLLDWRIVAVGEHPTMAERCFYGLFFGCTALVAAPELPSTTLAESCYYVMFYGCTALTTPPALPATTLAPYCYYAMFYECKALVTPPELPATTIASYCYAYMFYGCTALKTPPKLPAMTLASYCYYYMFRGCTALTTPPALPATTLAPYCYAWMCAYCKGIKLSETKTGSYQYAYRIPTSGTGTESNNSLQNVFLGTSGTIFSAVTGTPSINTTYYATAQPVG